MTELAFFCRCTEQDDLSGESVALHDLGCRNGPRDRSCRDEVVAAGMTDSLERIWPHSVNVSPRRMAS